MPTSRLLLAPTLWLMAACHSEPPKPPPVDAEPRPEGPHYTYVVSQASLPTTNPQATEYGLDLNDDKVIDNGLGLILAAIITQGVDAPTAMTRAIDRGDIILLLDVQTTSFSSTGSSLAGLQVKRGDPATATPAPCASTSDTTCRRHLTSTGMFGVAAGAPDHEALAGPIANGVFEGRDGQLSIQLALSSPEVIQLDLIGARVKASGISETGIDRVILAGAITQQDLDSNFLPTLHMQQATTVMRDCTTTTPPNCGCTNPSQGLTIIRLFDTMPNNCVLTLQEIVNSPLLKNLLAPDVTIDGQPALSFGMKVSAIKSTIR